MDRREFLTAGKRSGTAITGISKTEARTFSGLNVYNGPWTKNEVVHLLKRTMFGAKLSDISYFACKTMSEAVDELLNPTVALPDPPVKDYDGVTGATTPDNDVLAGTGPSYEDLFALVKKRMQSPSLLLENVCEDIIRKIKHEYPEVRAVSVSVFKLNPPIENLQGKVGVTLRKTFDD